MKKGLYFECSSGISGDMSVAALLNLGASQKKLLDTLKTLPLDGYQIKISTVNKSGITACDFDVILDKSLENHDHDMQYLHAHEQHHTHEHSHALDHQHTHEHSHAHEQHHTHEHSHALEHHHASCQGENSHHMHRNLNDVLEILRAGSLTPGALSIAERIFRILAEGEASAHGVSLEEVHFHEVGAVDSIVDIAALSICLDMLDYDEIFLTHVCDGSGTIRCQHGILPIPVPAVANIVNAYKLPLSILPVQGELVTPTGAAIAAAVSTCAVLPSSFYITRTGIGAGKRNYEAPGILRVMEIQYTA